MQHGRCTLLAVFFRVPKVENKVVAEFLGLLYLTLIFSNLEYVLAKMRNLNCASHGEYICMCALLTLASGPLGWYF